MDEDFLCINWNSSNYYVFENYRCFIMTDTDSVRDWININFDAINNRKELEEALADAKSKGTDKMKDSPNAPAKIRGFFHVVDLIDEEERPDVVERELENVIDLKTLRGFKEEPIDQNLVKKRNRGLRKEFKQALRQSDTALAQQIKGEELDEKEEFFSFTGRDIIVGDINRDELESFKSSKGRLPKNEDEFETFVNEEM